MVRLAESDIQTREVLSWRDAHLFHYAMSSCSQKTRIALNLKRAQWQGHIVDLSRHEAWSPWFMGINPRGLLPVLVLDGAVHIESNDILREIERRWPEPCLFPQDRDEEIAALLQQEDDLHLDLRTLSFRFVHGRTRTTKTDEVMQTYARSGSGTVGGRPDADRAREIAFYERLASEGVSDEACRTAAAKFRAAFDSFDARLDSQPWLMGDGMTALDVAWFVYAYRLDLGGYPLARLHPRLNAWYERLLARPEFVREVAPPPSAAERIAANRRQQIAENATLAQVTGIA